MGRDVYSMRIAYALTLSKGRSSHDPPIPRQSPQGQDPGEGSSTQPQVTVLPEQAAIQPETSSDHSELYSVPEQQYNSRGHPINPQSRAYGRSIRAAANDVLSVVGVVERKGSDGNFHPQSRRRSESFTDENSVGTLIGGFTEFGLDFATWWCECILIRLLAYPSSPGITFTELIIQRYYAVGPLTFFFSGKLGMYLGSFLGSTMWWGPQGVVLYHFDRLVIAMVSSKNLRDGYNRLRPYLAGLIGMWGTLIEIPLCLFSYLQILDLAPRNRILPPWRSLIPFSRDSPLGLGRTPLATLMYLFYSPISRRVESLANDTLEPPGATWAVSRRSSAQRRRAPFHSREPSSNNSASFWNRLSTHVASSWSTFISRLCGCSNTSAEHTLQPIIVTEPPSLTAPPITITENEDISEGPTPSYRDASVQIAPDELPDLPFPSPGEDATPIDENINMRLQPPNQDATIRISSIDSASGTVNLEIGLPEGRPSDAANIPDEAEEQSRRSSGATMERPGLRSELALEPHNFFLALNQMWLTRVALLPYRAIMWRLIALHFSAHSWPGKTAAAEGLKGLIGRNGAFGVYREMGFRGYADWLGKLGLCFMCDVAIGCGFWLVECGVVRFVGTRFFGWGRVKGKNNT